MYFICQYQVLSITGLRQSNFNGDPSDKRTCLPPPAVGQGTGRMAQCRMQIEKCKIAFCQIGTSARLHVCTLERWKWELEIGKWELGIGKWEFLFSVSCFPFLLYARLQSCKLESLQVNTLEMETGNFCFPFSIFLTVFCRLDPNSTTFGYFIPSLFHYSLI